MSHNPVCVYSMNLNRQHTPLPVGGGSLSGKNGAIRSSRFPGRLPKSDHRIRHDGFSIFENFPNIGSPTFVLLWKFAAFGGNARQVVLLALVDARI